MKLKVGRKVYNTETATLVKTNTVSYFGDPAGYEESLYKTPKGEFFIYGVGGAESKYPEEQIILVTAEEAEQF
ncbi:MAG: hypothetical protein E7559_02025 [Ruminococcaceae bacterium]|nr:hypothetical protein [Oscillospiraceae bacterium]